MATKAISQPHQAPLTCGLCEKYENVDSYCLGCKGNLCTACKISHTKVPMFRNHKVLPIIEGLKFQAEEVECTTHPLYICFMHCNDCCRLVCRKCISSGEHTGHGIVEIESALQRVQHEIEEYHETLKDEYLTQCKRRVEKITQGIAECKDVAMFLKLDINDKRSDMIIDIHNICDGLINRVDDEVTCNISDMDKAIHKLQDTINDIEQLMSESKKALTQLTYEKIKFNQEKPSLLHLDIPKAPALYHSTFLPGKLNTNQLAEQIGKLLVPQDLRKCPEINLENGISSVDAVDPHHILVSGYYDLEEMNLVTIDGMNIKRFKTCFEITDKTVATSGDIIITDYKDECIRRITQTGKFIHTIKTHPNKPSGICLGYNDQEIVVCVNIPQVSRWKLLSIFQRRHNTEPLMFSCKLVVYSSDGKEIRTVTYTDKPVISDKSTRQCLTQRVVKNNRGDYCVAHHGHNKVYVVEANGSLRYTYDGSDAGETMAFVPWDICSDPYNHLIISDFYNHKIHMVNDEGKFLRFILMEQDGITFPTGLCIGKDGSLWVGQRYGGLLNVKYLK